MITLKNGLILVILMIPDALKALYKRQGYKLVGSHSAVKPCTWLRKSLLDRGFCYKQKFYGINSHQCIQCTPAVAWCEHSCLFCWRPTEHTIGQELTNYDSPELIADGIINTHKQFLIGYKGAPGINLDKLEEAFNPKHIALSLSGEPTIYPKLGELIKEFTKRGMTTFVVTNGTEPDKLEELNCLPTQLYLTLPAPDEETYLKTCKPLISNGWARINKSLEIFSKLKTRRVIRLTLVRGLNMNNPDKYAELISKAKPDWVEVKSFMSVGFSRNRLPYDRMPLHHEIKAFSNELASQLGWKVIDEKADSRVCLIASQKAPNTLLKPQNS